MLNYDETRIGDAYALCLSAAEDSPAHAPVLPPVEVLVERFGLSPEEAAEVIAQVLSEYA